MEEIENYIGRMYKIALVPEPIYRLEKLEIPDGVNVFHFGKKEKSVINEPEAVEDTWNMLQNPGIPAKISRDALNKAIGV